MIKYIIYVKILSTKHWTQPSTFNQNLMLQKTIIIHHKFRKLIN